MKFTILTSLFFTALSVNAAVIESDTSVLRRDIFARQNAGRPVPNGGCCVANTSLKQDVCKVNGQSGRCVPAGVNNCGERLTCIEDSRLTCNAKVLERGRPLCRLRQGA
ncbi:hypothetical protein GE21DRAFT_8606 [Neurospora crassa]|uniref:Uncharacterized protein n=2 Tax=Neurospora TaxID=5140 RepID=Q7S6D6_NEUCR|nr:hypothetical protein NCU07088 [Neurospora crassa OR74A]EAA31117.1 hypothetical protein NCU07088 [Neurospora crassa OR74A]KAK3493012.1 hypothetical protein B0T23DRAFT_453960 [Neurospora hispaniola]KHE86838.1 hypothetical protein GE21DRAFT_8606 [Neurospora crassa]|eukprot:XP_960353.1 hypothetical protein NCU07088 [Neurospora crassa OR74A]